MSEQQLRTVIQNLVSSKSKLAIPERIQQLKLAANTLVTQTSMTDPDVLAAFKAARELKERSENLANLYTPVVGTNPVERYSSRDLGRYKKILTELEVLIYPIYKSSFDSTVIAYLTALRVEAPFPHNIKIAHKLHNKLFIHFHFSDLQKKNFKTLAEHIEFQDKPDGVKKSQGLIISPITAKLLHTHIAEDEDLTDHLGGDFLVTMNHAFFDPETNFIWDLSELLGIDFYEELNFL